MPLTRVGHGWAECHHLPYLVWVLASLQAGFSRTPHSAPDCVGLTRRCPLPCLVLGSARPGNIICFTSHGAWPSWVLPSVLPCTELGWAVPSASPAWAALSAYPCAGFAWPGCHWLPHLDMHRAWTVQPMLYASPRVELGCARCCCLLYIHVGLSQVPTHLLTIPLTSSRPGAALCLILNRPQPGYCHLGHCCRTL